MTAPTEPLTMTLEEFIIRLAEGDADLQYQPDAPTAKRNPGYWVIDARGAWGPYETWEEAAEDTFGPPVVARDDAAELRAVVRLSVRLLEWLSSREGTAPEDAREAEEVVRRARAALAASEGQS